MFFGRRNAETALTDRTKQVERTTVWAPYSPQVLRMLLRQPASYASNFANAINQAEAWNPQRPLVYTGPVYKQQSTTCAAWSIVHAHLAMGQSLDIPSLVPYFNQAVQNNGLYLSEVLRYFRDHAPAVESNKCRVKPHELGEFMMDVIDHGSAIVQVHGDFDGAAPDSKVKTEHNITLTGYSTASGNPCFQAIDSDTGTDLVVGLGTLNYELSRPDINHHILTLKNIVT